MERKPAPSEIGAEMIVICGMIKEPELVVPRVAAILTRESFSVWCHGLAFLRLVELYNSDANGIYGPGPFGLYWRLRLRNELVDFGGGMRGYMRWITDVWNCDPTGMEATIAAQKVARMATIRNLIFAARELERDAFDGAITPDDPRLVLIGSGNLTR